VGAVVDSLISISISISKISLTNLSTSALAVGCWPESAISNDAVTSQFNRVYQQIDTNYFIVPCITTEDRKSKLSSFLKCPPLFRRGTTLDTWKPIQDRIAVSNSKLGNLGPL
jgi:hypothetical protein